MEQSCFIRRAMDCMHLMCCEAVMLFQTSLSRTPDISLINIYPAPMALLLLELHERISGTGTLVVSLTGKTSQHLNM